MLRKYLVRGGVAAALVVIGAFAVSRESVRAFATTIVPFAASLSDEYAVKAILSVGDRVPVTGSATGEYQMVGIPDGMGAHASRGGTITVYMNHELTNTTQSLPVIGQPVNRGAFVSQIILDRTSGEVISGDRAYDTVYVNDTLIGPAAAVGNNTPGFGRFCSGSLAGPEHGFDRYIYFANEEGGAGSTFSALGGLSVAIFDNEAHALPYLGYFPWENTLVQPNTGRYTVIMGMEDGPANLNPAVENSQIYMYVGIKNNSPRASVLERNGLVGGTLYVFKSKDLAMNSELPFQNGTISGTWAPIPNAHLLSQAQLEAASDAAGAMTFGRPEDGAFNPQNRDEYFFVTTGGATGANALGRLYSLQLNKFEPWGDAELTVIYNADQIVAAGGDIAISPDNIDVSNKYLMINEDGTAESRAVMAAKGRDGQIWRFDLIHGKRVGVDVSSATAVVSLDPPGRTLNTIGPGIWETSGIIATDNLFGGGTWLFNVQAHGPTPAPATGTVEDGQLLLLYQVRGS